MPRVTSPDDPALVALCDRLREHSAATDRSGLWPAEQLRLLGEAGVHEWFVPSEHGGQGWVDERVTRGYLALSEACLTTTFVLTQRVGACRRIAGSANAALRARLLPRLLTGEAFATVGISHLTTSGRHLALPMLRAERAAGGWRLDGHAPWVTGAVAAEHVVVGASVCEGDRPTGDELLVAAPVDGATVKAGAPFAMVALTASATGPLHFHDAFIDDALVVAGPTPEVMRSGVGGSPGGPQTSTLAVGCAAASLAVLRDEASRRSDLVEATAALAEEHERLVADLLATARGEPCCTSEALRQRANSHALRTSQAALTATKGAGFLADAPAGRLCREALFFLVWSCPAPVQNASLCDLAGLGT